MLVYDKEKRIKPRSQNWQVLFYRVFFSLTNCFATKILFFAFFSHNTYLFFSLQQKYSFSFFSHNTFGFSLWQTFATKILLFCLIFPTTPDTTVHVSAALNGWMNTRIWTLKWQALSITSTYVLTDSQTSVRHKNYLT